MIEVGNEEEKQTFLVHKGLLSFYSGYFRAALQGAWAESSSGVIKLTTEDPLVFRNFVLWLYTNEVADDMLKSGHSIIVDLWLFADRRDIPLLMNEMINALHLRIADRWIMPIDCLPKVYMDTTEGSALRRMLAWSMSRTMDAGLLEGFHGTRWPQEALTDVLRLILADRSAPPLSQYQYKSERMCPTYHVHEDGASCTDEESTR